MAEPTPVAGGDGTTGRPDPVPAPLPVVAAFLREMPIVLAELRRVGAFYAFFSIVLPAGILFFVTTTGVSRDPGGLRYLAGGALAASLALGPAVMLCVRLGLANENDEFAYWASLPVPKISLVLAHSTGHLLFSLPGVVCLGLLAVASLEVAPLALVGALPLVPLAALAMVGIGALLGSRARNAITGNLISNLLIAVVLFLSPLMSRLDAYPGWLRPIAYLVPTTYVADAFRHVLGGDPTYLPFAVDLAVLLALTTGLLALAHRLLDWRGR